MKMLHHLVLGIITITALHAGADTTSLQTSPLKGTVVDADGHALEGVIIESYGSPTRASILSGEAELRERLVATNGTFELELPHEGSLILARKPGLATVWRLFWNGPEPEVRLSLGKPAGLAGTVVDVTGKPVVNAQVSVSLAMMQTEAAGGGRTMSYLPAQQARALFNARTSVDGRFRIEAFPADASANLEAKAPGKALRDTRPDSRGSFRLVCHSGDDDIRLVLEPAGVVEGNIVTDPPGQPLPQAQASLTREGPTFFGAASRDTARARADGQFSIPDVAAGSYRLRAAFGTNAVPDWVAETVPVTVESGQTNGGLQLSAIRGGLLEAAVTGQDDHKPAPGVVVTASKQGYQTSFRAGDDGRARLRLPPGEYQVVATKENRSSDNQAVTVEADKTNRVELELPAPTKITGVVRRPDNQPASGLPVQLVGGFGNQMNAAKTDASGHFELEVDLRQYGQMDRTYCVLVRDTERNLAVAQDVDEDTGPLDLRLAPGVTLVGRAELDGKPITNATAALIFWTGRSGMYLPGLARSANLPGGFEIPALPAGRRYGLNVSAPGYGQKQIGNVEPGEDTKRVELDPVELKPANLKLSGQVLDASDQPVAGASVSLNGDGQPNDSSLTDRKGRFKFDHVCEGAVNLYANTGNENGNVATEGGDTNVVLKLGASERYAAGATVRKLKGKVTDPAGQPVAGAQLAVMPESSRGNKTRADGSFSLNWSLQPWQLQQGGEPLLIVRDAIRNLAAAESIPEDVTNLDVQLKPALVISGRVEGPEGVALANAQVGLWVQAGRSYSDINPSPAQTDAQGRFELKTLPAGPDYMIYVRAKDHGGHQEKIDCESGTNRIELPPFVLKAADQTIAGQVLNTQDKPVSGVQVQISGDGQPDGNTTTDRQGRFRFKVCEGSIRLFVYSGSGGFANATAEAGDTNVVLQLGSQTSGMASSVPRRASLKGKPLPDLAAFGLAADAVPAGKPLLVCLLDAEQRPSRRSVHLLVEQQAALAQKGLAVIAIQAALTGADTWQAWTNSTPLPFPLGRLAEKTPAVKWATSVESLPWLILRDAQGNVAAEGFTLDELDAKLEALGK